MMLFDKQLWVKERQRQRVRTRLVPLDLDSVRMSRIIVVSICGHSQSSVRCLHKSNHVTTDEACGFSDAVKDRKTVEPAKLRISFCLLVMNITVLERYRGIAVTLRRGNSYVLMRSHTY